MGRSSELLTHYHEDAKTLYEVFQRGLHISGRLCVRRGNKRLGIIFHRFAFDYTYSSCAVDAIKM